MGTHTPTTIDEKAVQLPADSLWRKAPIIGAVLAAFGIGGTFALGGEHGEHLFAYLTAFLYWFSIAVGGLFFTMIFMLTRSGWNVVLRRLAENAAVTIPVFALLFIPILVGMETLYVWMDPEVLAVDRLAQIKEPFLNRGFFLVRAAVYFVGLGGLAVLFWSRSTKQDRTGDPEITRKLQAIAAPGIAIAALSATFATFDWNMSLDYHWFSTIYGVIFFAGAFMGFHALLAILVIGLHRTGRFGGGVNVEHWHGVGKMMFGLMAFWAYVSFSQLILIWYANIPEETVWYKHRIEGSWSVVSGILLFGHFLLPFFFLMSRHMKRNPTTLVIGAVWLLVMHYVDLYWMVMPNVYHGNAHFGPVEVLSMIGVGGAFFAAFGLAMGRNLIVPVKDPRLPESLAFDNGP